MKRRGILHDALSGALARLGHTDMVVVADCGLPRPPGVPVVDLALVFGVPTFAQVINALAEELVVERVTIASDTPLANPDAYAVIVDHFGVPELVSHEGLKALSARAVLLVRTGEATPYANAVLHCGVPF
ncbi:D-ribose pyranase [Demequina sp.]|uniref:D-ribose pyranase n=1 Tax=Demequina sp. TaxID=2050685 RepID=UPI0025B8DCAD|nr:D-ribose pyranase [Demequina sp.]